MSDFNHDFKEYNDLSLSDEVQSFEMSIAYEGFDSEAIRKIIRDKKNLGVRLSMKISLCWFFWEFIEETMLIKW